MKVFNKIIFFLGLFCGFTQVAFSQNPSLETNLIDNFYWSGKILVVIAGLILVLGILIFYLIRLEKKLNKAEKK